jgi:hypothetical protein
MIVEEKRELLLRNVWRSAIDHTNKPEGVGSYGAASEAVYKAFIAGAKSDAAKEYHLHEYILSQQISPTMSTPKTEGEKLVGSAHEVKDPKIARVTALCAELADIIDQDYRDPRVKTALEGNMYMHVMHDILVAKMMATNFLAQKNIGK